MENKEQLAELTIYKEGQVLTGADVSENGTVFQYENRRQKNAVYNVYAGADIVTAYGTKVYSKGDLVKENLTTGENGSVTLKNLHLGTYVVKETKAPDSFYNGSEEKPVTLTYAGQNKEVVFADVTFNNERQKADVSVVKQDKDTKKPLKGGIFALYASDDIRNADGTVVVKKGTLIEKATTGADGTAKFTADLPIGYSYFVKEDQAPEGYVRNTEDVYTFQFSYTNDKEATVSFTHTFSNDRVTAKINLFKVDKETGKVKVGTRVMMADATGGIISGIFGTSPVTSFAESTVGVESGARTGIAAITTGLLFFLSLAIFPVFNVFAGINVNGTVYTPCTSMALVSVGALMFSNLRKINWNEKIDVMACFITFIMILLTYSITNGIALGLIFYAVMRLVSGKGKETSPVIWILAVLFTAMFVVDIFVTSSSSLSVLNCFLNLRRN